MTLTILYDALCNMVEEREERHGLSLDRSLTECYRLEVDDDPVVWRGLVVAYETGRLFQGAYDVQVLAEDYEPEDRRRRAQKRGVLVKAVSTSIGLGSCMDGTLTPVERELIALVLEDANGFQEGDRVPMRISKEVPA